MNWKTCDHCSWFKTRKCAIRSENEKGTCGDWEPSYFWGWHGLYTRKKDSEEAK